MSDASVSAAAVSSISPASILCDSSSPAATMAAKRIRSAGPLRSVGLDGRPPASAGLYLPHLLVDPHHAVRVMRAAGASGGEA